MKIKYEYMYDFTLLLYLSGIVVFFTRREPFYSAEKLCVYFIVFVAKEKIVKLNFVSRSKWSGDSTRIFLKICALWKFTQMRGGFKNLTE